MAFTVISPLICIDNNEVEILIMGKKDKKITEKKEEKTVTEKLDELIEMKKNENSALKKIFESLKKPIK